MKDGRSPPSSLWNHFTHARDEPHVTRPVNRRVRCVRSAQRRSLTCDAPLSPRLFTLPLQTSFSHTYVRLRNTNVFAHLIACRLDRQIYTHPRVDILVIETHKNIHIHRHKRVHTPPVIPECRSRPSCSPVFLSSLWASSSLLW